MYDVHMLLVEHNYWPMHNCTTPIPSRAHTLPNLFQMQITCNPFPAFLVSPILISKFGTQRALALKLLAREAEEFQPGAEKEIGLATGLE